MDKPILSCTFDENVIQAAEGVYPIILPKDAEIAAGPGSASSVHLGPSGGLQADISDAPCEDISQFHVNIIFNLHSRFTGRQVLAKSHRIPFILELTSDGDVVKLVGKTRSTEVDWRETQAWNSNIRPEIWHSADLVYDGNTLTLFLDDRVVSIHSFGSSNDLEIDSYAPSVLIGGEKGPETAFNGRIAKFLLELNVPNHFRPAIEHHKTGPEWHITAKLETLRNVVDLGTPKSPVTKLPEICSWCQLFTNGALMYHSGAAFAMHDAILSRYTSLPISEKESLGYLISDEHPTSKSGGRKNVFQGGAIYHHPSTGTFEAIGEIYHSFEATGETQKWGFPIEEALPAPGGVLQQFQNGTFYFKFGVPHAHAVQGEILKAFVATGGLLRWGYPVSNEQIVNVNGLQRDVRLSEFEKGSFYWSETTGAHAVEGDIRSKWRALGGADEHYVQQLGLPTTEEMDIPLTDGARMSGFEQGVILWYNERDAMIVVYPFKILLKSLELELCFDTDKPDTGIYIIALVNQGDETVFYHRYPDSETAFPADKKLDVGIELPLVLKPQPKVPMTVVFELWKHENGMDHEHLGRWSQNLDASNAWGLMWNGKLEGTAGAVKKIEVEVKPVVEYLYD